MNRRTSPRNRQPISRQSLKNSEAMVPALVLLAYDAINVGILVVSQEGMILYYNAAFARLRKLAPGEMIGSPVDEIDRRGHVTALLHSGTPVAEKPIVPERRRNKEALIPIREGEQVLGCVVVVTPVSEMQTHAMRDTRGRASGNLRGDPTWPVQYTFADIIGNTPPLVRARELALRAAEGASSVLLVGESGTGKELFAHAIHAASPRRAFPFVPVDCSAIPHELLEAELFGYAPGAFTGADQKGKPGKFELAHPGTVFLDEIGEMPLEMQAKLLRVLQERRIIRVGGVTPIPVTFAVIAATNQDLESLVAKGRFRRDLLYRLDVVRIEIPSLRERPEDVPLLVEHYWERKCRELGKSAQLSAEALRVLEGYTWPGNIRELLNVVERLLVSASKSVIEARDLPRDLTRGLPGGSVHFPPFHLPTILAEAERRTLERALRRTQGNRNKAAQLVGMSRASFYRKLKAYGLADGQREKDYLHDLL